MLALEGQDGDSGLRRNPFLGMMNAFLSGCPCLLRGSQDTCKGPLRTLIYMASARIAEPRISRRFQQAGAETGPLRPPRH